MKAKPLKITVHRDGKDELIECQSVVIIYANIVDLAGQRQMRDGSAMVTLNKAELTVDIMDADGVIVNTYARSVRDFVEELF